MKLHVAKCALKMQPPSEEKINSETSADSANKDKPLEFARVMEGLYLVRKTPRGTGYPIHVEHRQEDGKIVQMCYCEDYKRLLTLTSRSEEHVAIPCCHLNSVSGNDVKALPEGLKEFNMSMMKERPGIISDTYLKDTLLPYCEIARKANHPVIAPYFPENKSGKGFTAYFSLYERKDTWWTHHNRVIVTFSSGVYSCKCEFRSRNWCRHIAVARSFMDEQDCFSDLIKGTARAVADKLVDADGPVDRQLSQQYLQGKSIPFVLDKKHWKFSITPRELSPKEKECVHCKGVLDHYSTNNGTIHRYEGPVKVKMHTKICRLCKITFRYQEHNQGIFNYNNNTLVEAEIMEKMLLSSAFNTSVEKHYNERIKESYPECKLTYRMMLDCFWLYLSMKNKEADHHLHCYRCGNSPKVLIADGLRSLNFSTKSRDVSPDLPPYASFVDLLEEAAMGDIVKAMGDDDIGIENMELHEAWPAVMNRNNMKPVQPPTIRGTANKEREFLETEAIPLSDLEALVQGPIAKINSLMKRMGVHCSGTKDQKIKAIGASKNYAGFYKSFTKVYGRSGGVVMFWCPHKILYAIKFLVQPEGTSDYAQIMMSFKEPPSVLICDFAPMVAATLENRSPGILGVFKGRVGDVNDATLLEYLSDPDSPGLSFKGLAEDYREKGAIAPGAHSVSGREGIVVVIDEFHYHNHKNTPTKCLWNSRSIRQLRRVNTSAAEQENSLIASIKPHSAQCTPGHFMQLVLFYGARKNIMKNAEEEPRFKASLRKSNQDKNIIVDKMCRWWDIEQPGQQVHDEVKEESAFKKKVLPEEYLAFNDTPKVQHKPQNPLKRTADILPTSAPKKGKTVPGPIKILIDVMATKKPLAEDDAFAFVENDVIKTRHEAVPHEYGRIWVHHDKRTMRSKLYTKHRDELVTFHEWLSAPIIDSYSYMCLLQLNMKPPTPDSCATTAPGGRISYARGNRFIQVCNTSGNHWYTIFSEDCKLVRVYDSSCFKKRVICRQLLDVVNRLTLNRAERIEYIECQQQQDGFSCGLFALAAVWALSRHREPMDFHIDPKTMRERVIQTFENNVVVGLKDQVKKPAPIKVHSIYDVKAKKMIF